jgi:signal peptidase
MLQALNFASVLASGLMIYKGLGLITNTESPIVVVLRCVISSPRWYPLPTLSDSALLTT